MNIKDGLRSAAIVSSAWGGLMIEAADRIEELEAQLAEWNKHDAAEEPSELYFNEVYGIGSMRDQYRIAELEAQLAEAQKEIDRYEKALRSSMWKAIGDKS